MAKTSRKVRRPVVWVTGASSGIGREVAKQFASLGCEVVLSARRTRELEAGVREIRAEGGRARAVTCDITQSRSVAAAVKRIHSLVGSVDVLINNAGVTAFRSFLNTTAAEFQTIMETNLLGQVTCIREVIPGMVDRNQGWIINVISTVAIKTFAGSSAYTAAKAGLYHFARVLREELKIHNIKVVNVLPGATDTPMWSDRSRERFRTRMMAPASVAGAILAAYQMPPDLVVDDLVIRPILGDLE